MVLIKNYLWKIFTKDEFEKINYVGRHSAWQGLSDQTLSGILAVFPVIRVFPVNLGTDPVPYFHGDWSWISTVILLPPAESLHILTGVFF